MIHDNFQHNPCILNMLILTEWVSQNVIDKHNQKHIKVLINNPIHEIHKHYRGINQTKLHYQKLIMTTPSSLSCLRNVCFFQQKLVITQPEANHREISCSFKLIKQIIYPLNNTNFLNGNIHSKRTNILSNKKHKSTHWWDTWYNNTLIQQNNLVGP